ncbi:hypothetical protein [Chryseobacterium sp. FH1]|uniref:hypothetical protein n=1 Tax=Chryseobacterium sp. FH1 TaxID=1233951 RepID=UPI0004E335AF|nr:hypothetical protein [Chryseobacterium sp. FH1]KFC19671.1 hypothetical protein IO90_10385 [Chryseobacterium sp. FH1]
MAAAGIIIISQLENNKYIKIKKVISTINFLDSIFYDKYGNISKFRIDLDDSYYIKTVETTQQNGTKIIYYNEADYSEFKSGIKELNKVRIFDINKFIPASTGDEISIYLRQINLISTPSSYCYNFIKWIYDETIFSNTNSDKIDIPTIHTVVSTNCSILSSEADNFFQYYSNKLKTAELNIGINQYEEVHNLIADIAGLLDSIDDGIYKLYETDPNFQISFNPPLSTLIQNQLQELSQSSISLYELNTFEDFQNHYIKVSNYFNDFFNDLMVLIKNGTDLDKIVKLLISISPKILIPISIEDKLKILSYLAAKKLETSLEEGFKSVITTAAPIIGNLFYENNIDKYENLVVKICQSFDQSSLDDYNPNNPGVSCIDVFLEGLLKNYKDGSTITLFEAVYSRLSTSWNATETVISLTNWVLKTDYKPKNTKGAFVQAIYSLWEFSKYNPFDINGNIKQGTIGFNILDASLVNFNNANDPNNQNTLFKYTSEVSYESYLHIDENIIGQQFENTLYKVKWGNASPITMPYESNKFIGIYFDNFDFEIKNKQIIAKQKGLPTSTRYDTEMNAFDPVSKPILYGSYDLFQPVSLLNINSETKFPILTTTNDPADFGDLNLKVNSLIPIFVLYHIDSAGDRSDAETMLGYSVDAVLTFSGVGNLTKLRHLRWIALGANEVSFFTRQGLRIFWSGIEFTTGALGFFANFIECNTGDEFCHRMKEFIFLFEIFVGGISATDTIASLAMRNKAKQVAALAGGTTPDQIRANLKNRFQQLHPNENPAILQQAADAVFYSSIVPIPIAAIKRIVNKITAYVAKRKNLGGRKLWDLDASYTNAFLEAYTQLCKNQLGLTDDFILDYVYFANRKYFKNGQWHIIDPDTGNVKFIATEQLVKRTNFHKLEIVKRGFGGGFNNLGQYKQYCNSARNRFINNLQAMTLDVYDTNFTQYISSLECSVKGSSVTVPRVGDPPPIHHTTDLPIGFADDIDNKFGLSQSDFAGFLDELDIYVEANHVRIDSRQLDKIKSEITYARNTGALGYSTLEKIPIGNSNFTTLMKQAMKPHTQFPENKINFFIMVNRTDGAENVKKITQYDNLPELPYSY